jgi:hypothetical protein
VLLGGLGGLAAAALGSLARPVQAAATDHSALVVGEANSATLLTSLTQATAATGGLKVSAPGIAVEGDTSGSRGVYGKAVSGSGVYGEATTGTGMKAVATTGNGVQASNASTAKASVTAQNANATTGAAGVRSAVQGFAGTGAVPAPQTETGVEGICNLSINSVGVYGGSTNGWGVVGATTDGNGVGGFGYYGVYGSGAAGVVGDVDGGTGVQGWTGVAAPPDPPVKVGVWAGAENGRTALQTQGVAKFNRSGRASIAVGASSKVITVTGGITAAAFGIANLQTNRAGYYVQAVVPNTANSTITVYLNKAVTTTAVSVGWIVFG